MPGLKTIATTAALLASAAEASIFWEKLQSFYGDMSFENFQEVLAWQIAGLFIPLVAGPMRVAAYILWNVDQAEGADYMKAYLYFYDIYGLDTFWGYFMDYAIYGKIYSILGWTTDFYEIDFAPTDILCYALNGYDPAVPSSTVPSYAQNSIATAAGVTCTSAVSP